MNHAWENNECVRCGMKRTVNKYGQSVGPVPKCVPKTRPERLEELLDRSDAGPKFKDWEYMLKNAIYTTLSGYQQPNGYTIACAVRLQMEDKILAKFKNNLSHYNYSEPKSLK